jgi:hypothetical protein
MAWAFSQPYSRSLRYNLFVFEKKTKRIFATPEASGRGYNSKLEAFSKLWAFY